MPTKLFETRAYLVFRPDTPQEYRDLVRETLDQSDYIKTRPEDDLLYFLREPVWEDHREEDE